VKSKKEKSGLNKADVLIEEAMQSLERREAASKPNPSAASEIVEQDEDNFETNGAKSREAVAKIDLKQYVEREAYLRMAADFENFRRRAVKERTDAERSGREKILRGFLEILDNLERGLVQVKEDQSSLAEGIRIILTQIDSWLKSEGLDRIESVGKNFDPLVHDALSQRESDEPVGMVIEEIKRGYSWSNRLLRPATVVVSKGPALIPDRGEK
jgi:molecular chaperone GrpE